MKTFCSYFNHGICFSCKEIETSYPDQLKKKEAKLLEQLTLLSPFELLPSIESLTMEFRNKAKLVITGSLDSPIIGLAGEEDLDQGRDIRSCPLHHKKINEVLAKIPAFIQLSRLEPYSILKRKGEIKGLIVYYSQEADSMYIRLILRSKESLDRLKKNAPFLLSSFPFIHTLTANIQPIPHAILEGEEEILLAGNYYLPHQLGGMKMNLSPKGFVQTNQALALKLYQTATSWAKELKPEKFLELFCGQGAFSFFIQEEVKAALGIEIDQEAVKSANQTALQLGFNHLKFVAKDASSIERELVQFGADLILVNPPRKGLGKSLELIKNHPSRFLIYSSCSVDSLTADLKELSAIYRLKKVQIFDMFPHTFHFETLALLELNDV